MGALGPQNMNDEAVGCGFYWPMSLAPNYGTIQYTWSAAVTIDHFVVAADAYCAGGAPPNSGCAMNSGRSVSSVRCSSAVIGRSCPS